MKMMNFYTYDLELLDTHFEKSLLDNLRSLEYSYEKKAWGECRLDFDFQKRDWHTGQRNSLLSCKNMLSNPGVICYNKHGY